MTLCVTGITGLQLYWNYQNYRSSVKTFEHDISEALNTAVNEEIDQRQQKIVDRFKNWMADTTFVQITCSDDNRHGETVFHMQDTHPLNREDKGISLAITDFKAQLSRITPTAKKVFIDHVGDIILKQDLIKGIVYFYTQRLGDSLSVIYNQSKLNIDSLRKLYRQALLSKGIDVVFTINPDSTGRKELYLTQRVNTALRRPYEREFIDAGFQSPDAWFLRTMKWLIVSSLLLIGITIFCFGYTVTTLLSQNKLALLKDDFINNMTHELNTPISSIKITAEALRTFDYDHPTQKGYFDIISYQVERLSTLTTQILNAARIKKSIQHSKSNIELNELIERAIKDMQLRYRSADAIINYSPAGQKVYIKAEASSMINAFVNIIDNALKYSYEAQCLHIALAFNQTYAEVSFADNGIGIPAEYRSKVFDRFFRVPKGNTHDVKGYGLGLSYVKQVIEQHRGSVSVAANVPAGSIFTVKLPLG